MLFPLASILFINSYAQHRIWFGELGANITAEQNIKYDNGSIKNSPAFGYWFNINNGGRRIAVSAQFEYAPIHLKNVNTGPVKENSLGLWEFYFGLRYYPMLPNIRIGTKAAIRFIAGGLAGFYNFYWKQNDGFGYHQTWSASQLSPLLYGGLCFSSFRNTSGLSLKISYKPQTYSIQNFSLKDFTLKQPFLLTAGIFIGPKVK
ncbi:MAG TPA: hypothetical protein VET23_01255 [Chitinophagaceae bacterium]|nr:hypothetical protein [Chitinophagaceae bacterium]